MKNIEESCAKLLTDKGLKVAVAESCTGGLISSKLTSISGSSAYFDRGFVTYSNLSKIQMLGVSEEIINKYGTVSHQTAVEMVSGTLRNSNADIAIAVTGIAGPTGGTPQKPVGTVFIAIATKEKIDWQRHNFIGSRLEIREQAAVTALNMLKAWIK